MGIQQIAEDNLKFFNGVKTLPSLISCKFPAIVWNLWDERNSRMFQHGALRKMEKLKRLSSETSIGMNSLGFYN